VRLLDGGLFVSHHGKPFAVYERLNGQVTCQKMVNKARARNVGAALASVHLAPLGDLEVGPSRFDFDGIVERLLRVRESGRTDLLPAVQRIESLTQRLRQERRNELPEGLIHGDLFRDNVLIEGDEVAGLLDFESASQGPFIFDLMVTVLAWCFGARLEPDLARAMVEGYISVRPLLRAEQQAMVLEGSVVCARFATTRLTDFSLRALPGEKPGRDYGRFFERLTALEAGELDAALSGLF
jgi:homoserine kinase type II